MLFIKYFIIEHTMSKMTPKRDYKTFKQPLKIGAVCPWEKIGT